MIDGFSLKRKKPKATAEINNRKMIKTVEYGNDFLADLLAIIGEGLWGEIGVDMAIV